MLVVVAAVIAIVEDMVVVSAELVAEAAIAAVLL